MLTKLKEFMKTPMTWGGFCKLCFWSGIISMVISIPYVIWMFWPVKKLDKQINEMMTEESTEPVKKGKYINVPV